LNVLFVGLKRDNLLYLSELLAIFGLSFAKFEGISFLLEIQVGGRLLHYLLTLRYQFQLNSRGSSVFIEFLVLHHKSFRQIKGKDGPALFLQKSVVIFLKRLYLTDLVIKSHEIEFVDHDHLLDVQGRGIALPFLPENS